MKKTVFFGFMAIMLAFCLIGCDILGEETPGSGETPGTGDVSGLVVRQIKAEYSISITFSKAIRSLTNNSLTIPRDDTIIGGGILLHVKDIGMPTESDLLDYNEEGHYFLHGDGTDEPIPVDLDIQHNYAVFKTVPGHAHIAYLDLWLDGADDTGMCFGFLAIPFIATDSDEITFCINAEGGGLFVNDIARESNFIWMPDNVKWVETPDGDLPNHESREKYRERNYLLYGGDGYVARFLVEE